MLKAALLRVVAMGAVGLAFWIWEIPDMNLCAALIYIFNVAALGNTRGNRFE